MKKKLCSVLILLLTLSLLIVSCGGKSSKSGVYKDNEYGYAEEAFYERSYAPAQAVELDMAAFPGASMKAVKTASGGANYANSTAKDTGTALLSDNIQNLNVKLIYRANISVQTLNYDEAYASICSLVDSYGGYFENAYKYNGSIDDNTHPFGNYSIRIPSEKYDDFVNKIGEASHLVNIEQSVEDVSLSYADIEQHLKTLNTKHDRLITLLASAKDMKDIISLENALSDCEDELDRYSSRKIKYDSLINYSTIRLNLQEVERLEPAVPEKPLTYGQRLAKAIKRGFNNTIESISNFIIWFLSHIIGIVFWCGIIVLAVFLIRKRKAVRALRKVQKEKEREED